MLASLQSLSEGPNLPLNKPIMLIGRAEECDLQLNSTKISRRHCVIVAVGERLLIRDLGSTNGVRINGARHDQIELHHGDELTLGNFFYRVSICSDPTPVPPMNFQVSSEFPLALPDEANEAAPIAKKAPPTD